MPVVWPLAFMIVVFLCTSLDRHRALYFVSWRYLCIYMFHCDVSQMSKRTTMRTEYMLGNWSCIVIKGEVSRDKTGVTPPSTSQTLHPIPPPPPPPGRISTDRFKVVPLFQSFLVCASMFS